MRVHPLVLLCAAGVLWGTGGIAGSALQRTSGLSPVAVGFWRLAVAGCLLLAWFAVAGRLRRLALRRRDLPRVVAVGLLLAVFQACYFAAVARLGVAVATLVTLGSAPVLVAAVTAAGRRAWPRRRTATALAVALTGLAAVVSGVPASGGGGVAAVPAAGLALALTSAAGFSAMTIVASGLPRYLPATTTVSLGFCVGAVGLAVPAAVSGAALPAAGWAALSLTVYLGAVPTALAYGLYVGALRRAEPTSAALAALLEPVTAAVLAFALLGERFGVLASVGAVLVLAGLAVQGQGRGAR